MRGSLVLFLLFVTTTAFAGEESATKDSAVPHRPVRLAFLCLLKGEQTSGLNKLCFYDCPVGDAAITVKSWERCPVSIDK